MIYHIANKNDIEKAFENGYYQTDSLTTEGFIHCSTKEEVVNTANRVFKNADNLFLLELDESKIAAEIKIENTTGGKILYPHIYGVLNCNAIVRSFSFHKQSNGEFAFPDWTDVVDLFMAENNFIQCYLKIFSELKLQSEKAIEQLEEKDLFVQQNVDSNSIAIIVQHISGNMISRWTDFLTTDGEKPYRKRDVEFEKIITTKDELLRVWEQGWKVFLDTLNSLTEKDLLKVVYIRKEPHSVIKAIIRQVSHYAYHTGQIVYLAKQLKSDNWKTLSIARGKSNEFIP